MERRRDHRQEQQQLYITVPSHFRCPISLDIMKSPVSLCTGVTYDRSSIQHWLDSGHDTCPATMQLLPSKDLVPNLTLHRLISRWSSSSSVSPSSSPPISGHQIRSWTCKIDGEADADSIEKAAKAVEGNQRVLAGDPRFVEAVAGVLIRERVEVRVLELVVGILDRVLIENGVKERLNRVLLVLNCNNGYNCLLRSFVSVLGNGNPNSKAQAVRVMEAVFSLNNESKRFAAETPDLLPVLINLLKTETDASVNDAVLSLLVSLSPTRSVKTQLSELGLVGILSEILSDKRAVLSVAEKSLKLLSKVCTVAEGRAAISEDPGCAGAVVERLLKVSKAGTEDGVVVLWSMCCVYRDGRVRERVAGRNGNGMLKVLLVMQSVGEGTVRRMCGDLVKVLRGGAGGLGCYDSKTMHVMPC